MESLVKSLSKYISINNSDIEIINTVFKEKKHIKGGFLIEEGKRADKLFFIESGLVRMYFTDENGKEIHTYFATDTNFITSFSSFINKHISVESIRAVKQTKVYVLNYSDFKSNNEFMHKFRSLFAEQNLVCIKERLDLLQNSNARKKYDYFIKNTDYKIINGIPLYQIATYLGITAESLSRIRKNLFLTKSQEN